MKVMMIPHWLNIQGHQESGIKEVVKRYTMHGAAAGIEFVDSNATSFDLLAVHAGMSNQIPTDAPLVCHAHGLYWSGDYNAEYWEYKANRSVIDAIRHAAAVTVPSEWVSEPLRRDLHLMPHVLPHGVDWQEWQHSEPNEGYILGYAKNRTNSDVCNPQAMGELAKQFPQHRFLGTFAPPNATPNIKATGVVPHDKMKRMIQQAAVVVSPIKETFGVFHLEAMAAGIPILGFRHGGILDTVQHCVSGYLATPGDYDDLARGLEYCLEHRQILGDNGRELAKQFTWQRVMEQLHGIYTLTLEKYHQPDTVAVVVPCFNYGDKVARAVESVMVQTYPAHEVIIVDNNSTDNTKEVARQLADKYPTVRYVKEEKQGVAHARNRGIRESTSKFIVPLDADDEIKPTFIDVCLRALKADPSLGLAYARLEWVRQDGQRGVSDWPGEYNYDGFAKKQNQVSTCCLFRRDLWQRLGGYRQRYAPGGAGAEDAEFWMRMGALGYGGKLATKDALFVYHLGGRVSSGNGYVEPDWLAGKPWVQDGKHPFASLATPKKHSHEVSQYDEPVVSVVIPVTDHHKKYLPDALDSLESQTFRKWEAVVVWDGAYDGNKELSDIIEAYPFIRIAQTGTHYAGAGAARNAGAKLARGTFLLFLDADDWLRPDAITRMLQAWQQSESIIYSDYAGHAYIDNPTEIQKLQMRKRLESYNEKTKEAVTLHPGFDYDCEEALRQPRIWRNGEYYIWNLIASLVPRRWHDEIGGFDESMQSWEDWDYWLRMARAGKCFTRIMEPLLDYRMYTGTRRELASSNEDASRQLRENLLQYMTEKYKEQKAMPCGSCGKKRAAPLVAATPAMAPQMSSQMNADNVVWVRLTDGNLGDHKIIGHITKTDYGQRKHGDLFKMMSADAAAAPHKFAITSDPNALPVNATVAPVATPAEPPKPLATTEPVKTADFATWPKKAGRPKKKVA